MGTTNASVRPLRLEPLPERPLVSVSVPNYNGAEFLEETMQSVLNQEYDNVELIVMDGGSTDGSLDILHRYDDDLRVVWKSQPDVGPMDAIFNGWEIASGDLVGTIPSNDLYTPDAFAEMVGQFNADAAVAFAGGWFEGIDVNGAKNGSTRFLRRETMGVPIDDIITNGRLPHINASLMRRDITLDVLGTGIDRRFGDTVFTIQYMLEAVRRGGRILSIGKALHNNRRHPNNRGSGIAITMADRVEMKRGAQRLSRTYADVLAPGQVRAMRRWGYERELTYKMMALRWDSKRVSQHWTDEEGDSTHANPALAGWEKDRASSRGSQVLGIVPPLMGYLWSGGWLKAVRFAARKLPLVRGRV